MSSLLEQAIIDATALKQAATKNAEKNLIDKYSHKIKEAVDKLLEQDMAAVDPNADPAAMPGAENADAASSLENTPSDLAGAEDPNAADMSGAEMEPPEEKKDPLEKVKSSFMMDGKDDELITIDFSSLKAKPVTPMGAAPVGAVPPAGATPPPAPAAAPPAPAGAEAAPPAPMQEGLRQYEYDESELEESIESDDELDEEMLQYESELDEVLELDEEEMCEGGGCGEDMNTEPTGVLVQIDEDDTYAAGENIENLHGEEFSDEEEKPKKKKDPLGLSAEEEEFVDLEESLIVDMEGVSDGWRGAHASERREIENVELARLQDEEVQLKIREYEDAVESAKKKVKKAAKEKEVLMKENMELKSTLVVLKEHIEKMNLSNAKLLYMNRALGNNSFNERQKQQIVETISRAQSVEGAKIAFETLQGSVQSVRNEAKTPKSLNEAVSRSSSPFLVRPKNREESPVAERMKVLAGIK